MATFKAVPPDDLQDDTNEDINMLHSVVKNLVENLNYGMNNIDIENMTDEVASIIESGGSSNE